MLAAKRDEAADHLWSLREDPGCFEMQLTAGKEHRVEMMKDCHGQMDHIAGRRQLDMFWASVIGQVISQAYTQLEVYTDLHDQAE